MPVLQAFVCDNGVVTNLLSFIEKPLKVIRLKDSGFNLIIHPGSPQDIKVKGKVGWVQTDYFGGLEYRTARLFIDGTKVFDASNDNEIGASKYYDKPINMMLKQLGVVARDGMDEFNTLGIGDYKTKD